MPTCERRRATATAPLLRIVTVVTLVSLTAPMLAAAQVEARPPCTVGLEASTTMPDATWRTVVDVDHAFALRVPPGHALTGGDGHWYVHGLLDGAPLVPDVAISLLGHAGIDDAIARDFPAGTRVERIQLGPATTGARVYATYATPDGTPYRQAGYLVETDRGVLRIDRYEGFDWDAFDGVACSVHTVEVLD